MNGAGEDTHRSPRSIPPWQHKRRLNRTCGIYTLCEPDSRIVSDGRLVLVSFK